jgi:hypothetical protein
MFQNLTIRGIDGTVVRGHRTAVRFKTWVIHKNKELVWTLSGDVSEIDTILVRQSDLLFHAPRPGPCWPVLSIKVDNKRVVATLGQPEQGT